MEVTLEVVPEFLAGTAPEGDAAIHRLADWVHPKLGLRFCELAAVVEQCLISPSLNIDRRQALEIGVKKICARSWRSPPYRLIPKTSFQMLGHG